MFCFRTRLFLYVQICAHLLQMKQGVKVFLNYFNVVPELNVWSVVCHTDAELKDGNQACVRLYLCTYIIRTLREITPFWLYVWTFLTHELTWIWNTFICANLQKHHIFAEITNISTKAVKKLKIRMIQLLNKLDCNYFYKVKPS